MSLRTGIALGGRSPPHYRTRRLPGAARRKAGERSTASRSSQLGFDVIDTVDLRPEHGDEARQFGRLSKEYWATVILLRSWHDALDLEKGLDESGTGHGR